MYRGVRIDELSPQRRVAIAKEIVAECQRADCVVRPELTHFQRQSDFLLFQGNAIVQRIYSVTNIDALFNDIEEYIHVRFPRVLISNRATIPRSKMLMRILNALRPYAAGIVGRLPDPAKEVLRRGVYRSASRAARDVLRDPVVRDFVNDHYADDRRLSEEVERRGGRWIRE